MQMYHDWVVMETLGLITHYKRVGNDVLEALALYYSMSHLIGLSGQTF